MADSIAEQNRRALMEKEREKMLNEFARKKEQLSKVNCA
jgi:protein FAM50